MMIKNIYDSIAYFTRVYMIFRNIPKRISVTQARAKLQSFQKLETQFMFLLAISETSVGLTLSI